MADEVFSGGVSVTGVEPGTTTIAIKSTTNPNISKKVPVTVKSRNLLAYGPASGNGLTVTVAQDGSLDFSSGTESVPLNKGVRWKFDVPEGIVGVPLIISYTGNVPGNLIIGIYANANSLGGVYQGKNNTVVTIPKGTTRVELRILRGGVTAGSVSGNLKIQLELGNTAHEWMKPDVTSLEGGGYELANLVPSFASLLPKTINGVTFTSRDGHTVHVKGTTTAWAQINVSVRLDAGTYMLTCDNSNGWNYGTQFSGIISGHDSLGNPSVKLETGTYTVSVFVAEGKTVDIDLTPRIHRLD
jgi:hypothetical protein